MADPGPAAILGQDRVCADCGNPTLDMIAGVDGWGMLSMNSPSPRYLCARCGAGRELLSKGATLSVVLVGLGLLAVNLSDDGAASLFAHIAAYPAEVMRDVLADGVFGVLGYVLYTVLLGTLFILLPLVILASAAQGLHWRWRNRKAGRPGTAAAGEVEEVTAAWQGGVQIPEPEKRSWHWWATWRVLSRAIILGLAAEISFTVLIHAAGSWGGVDLAAAALSGGLWWFLMTRKTVWQTPLWLVIVFFFIFLLPTAMFVDIVLLGRFASIW